MWTCNAVELFRFAESEWVVGIIGATPTPVNGFKPPTGGGVVRATSLPFFLRTVQPINGGHAGLMSVYDFACEVRPRVVPILRQAGRR